jgi:hypothetical protein
MRKAIASIALCAIVSACSGSINPVTASSSGVPVPTIAPVTVVPPKIPLRGLIDMQDISWHNVDNGQPAFDISNVNMFPGVFGGIVINATWSQMQPAQGGAVNFSAVDAALASIRAYNTANQSLALGVKLRIYGGSNAPAWAKSLDGGPVTIYRNPAGCNGKTDSCPLTVGPFWKSDYIADWRAFQAKVAAKYDTAPLIVAVAVTSCASQTDEPFVATTGPIGKANLAAAGYTDAAEQSCLTGAIDDYSAWVNTDIDFTFNAYDKSTGGLDTAFTQSVMTLCRQKAAARCVLDNHALQTPLTSDLTTYSAIAAAGAPINFQTQSPEGMGCIWPETITQGILLGARAIEVWPEAKYQGFDTLTVTQVQSLRAQFYAPAPTSTPVPNPLPTPCSGFN